jgi:hypothetical protein
MNDCCLYTVCRDELIYEIKTKPQQLDELFLKILAKYSKLPLTDANKTLIRRIGLEVDVAKDLDTHIGFAFKTHFKQFFDCNCA